MSDEDQVRAANAAYYAAFEGLSLDAMSASWEHSDRVSVTHPGWPTLRGWARVAGSWEAIFANTGFIQFVLTDEVVTVVGDVAWMTLDENILQATGSPEGGGADTEELDGAPHRGDERVRPHRRGMAHAAAPRLARLGGADAVTPGAVVATGSGAEERPRPSPRGTPLRR